VVQKHDARRLHYDVRLEIGGTMASWAVPKGPSYDPDVRRLAIQTEDHPIEYNEFEGRIPDGEYGAGDVLIWDRGHYQTVPPGQERAMLAKGHLRVRLEGTKLVGEWNLVRLQRSAGSDRAGLPDRAQWLMFKAKDEHADPSYDVTAEKPGSVVSGRRATRGPRRAGGSAAGKTARNLYEAVGPPALATPVSALPDPVHWTFEIKYDGYRLLACRAGSDVRLYTRSANDWTHRFEEIKKAVSELPVDECVIDGEVCAFDEVGRSSLSALQQWLAGQKGRAHVACVAFDLLWLDGRDLRAEPVEARRELLERLLEGHGPILSFSRSADGEPAKLVQVVKDAGLEGLIAKRRGSRYPAGRTSDWLKLRFYRRQECAIAGWIPMVGTADQVGALLLAVADGQRLVFAGRVGTGFDASTRRSLARRLDAHPASAPQVEGAPRTKGANWAIPTLVCECRFVDWTRDGSMREPRYLGLREDKVPLEAVRELGQAEGRTSRQVEGDRTARPSGMKGGGRGPHLLRPEKILFPRDGITKRDIWDYFANIAPVLLPHLSGRPLTLQRYPDGIDGQEWYQQNAPAKTPAFVRLVDVGPLHENKNRIVCDNLETLQWLANLAALTIHQWSCHVPATATTRASIDRALAQPDYFVLDLDPGSGPWAHVIEVAHAVRTLLEALALEGFVKTSGKRGLHIAVPTASGSTHDQATEFAEQIARAVAKVLPQIATVERMKDKRGGKLYVDYGQNGEGRTIVSPYAIRARDGAVVSTPIQWDEVTERLDPTTFTIRTVLERVSKHGDLFAGAMRTPQRMPIGARAVRRP
jgi:bifunctional non-homologous end joining protein LigD